MRLLLCVCILLFVACGEEETVNRHAFPDMTNGIEAESFGVRYIFSDSARVTANLSAGHVVEREEKEHEEDKKGLLVHYLDQGVNIETINKFGQTTSTITSERAIYRREKGQADLYDQVVIVNYQGERLETEKLFWDEQKDSIYTDTLVRIETPTQIINGSGMRAKADFSAYIIENIVGEVEVKEGGNP